jgi:hypothetical protein
MLLDGAPTTFAKAPPDVQLESFCNYRVKSGHTNVAKANFPILMSKPNCIENILYFHR